MLYIHSSRVHGSIDFSTPHLLCYPCVRFSQTTLHPQPDRLANSDYFHRLAERLPLRPARAYWPSLNPPLHLHLVNFSATPRGEAQLRGTLSNRSV